MEAAACCANASMLMNLLQVRLAVLAALEFAHEFEAGLLVGAGPAVLEVAGFEERRAREREREREREVGRESRAREGEREREREK